MKVCKKQQVLSHQAPQPVGAYSQAVLQTSDGCAWLYISGQIPLDLLAKKIVSQDITTQTKMVMEYIQAILSEEGFDFNHVVKTTIFLKSMNHFAQVNQVYSRYFSEPFPARACVAVQELPRGAEVEIDAIAIKSL